MRGRFQVWQPTQEAAQFPSHYRKLGEIEASDLHEVTRLSAGRLRESDIVVDPAFRTHVYEGGGEFRAYVHRLEAPVMKQIAPPGSEIRNEFDARDREFAGAVLGKDHPDPAEIERIVNRQKDLCIAQSEDRAIMQAYDDYFDHLEALHHAHPPELGDIELEL